jgi:hypothetical protein
MLLKGEMCSCIGQYPGTYQQNIAASHYCEVISLVSAVLEIFSLKMEMAEPRHVNV